MRAGIPNGWDAAVQGLHGHFLQSAGWARVQARLGNQAIFDGGADWCWMGVVKRAGPFRYLYLPLGPSVRSDAALGAALTSARMQARRLHCAFVRFEPGPCSPAAVARSGARKVKSRQYEHTLLLDISLDEAELRRGLAAGHRSAVNGAARRGLTVESSNDPARMAEFLRLLRATERRAGFYSYDDPYFAAIAAELLAPRAATLYFAMFEGAAVATALVFDFGSTRYYAYGAADPDARKLAPAPALVWQTILDARTGGGTRYDLWGAAPPDASADHPWAGITYFKRAFGSQPVGYAGTWELPVRPLAARAFDLVRQLHLSRSALPGLRRSRRSRSDS